MKIVVVGGGVSGLTCAVALLEAEQAGGTVVIHDYGHDGSGVFWSWGCAADVVALCGLN
jgi:protoporphyrinogen oxidase